jgi:hypothetical protein
MIIRAWDKLFRVLVGLLVIFAVVFGTCTFWLLWPYDPITVHQITLLNPDKTVWQGDYLRYYIKWTKHTDRPGRLMRYWVNGHKFPIDDDIDGGSLVSGQKGGPFEAEIAVKMPDKTPTGDGRMQWSITYQMNPLRPFNVPPVYSDDGKVVAK